MNNIITGEQEDEDRVPPVARRQKLMRKAIAQSTILTNPTTYATNGLEKIITWIKNRRTAQASKTDPNVIDRLQIEIKPATLTDAARMREVQLTFVGTVPIQRFTKACSGIIDKLPLELNDGH